MQFYYSLYFVNFVLFIEIDDSSITGEYEHDNLSDNAHNVLVIDDGAREEIEGDDDESAMNLVFRQKLRQWAVDHQINRVALKPLLKIIKEHFEKGDTFLPEDPRTLLRTPQVVNVSPISGGEYWHHGFGNCLNKIFQNLNESITISININIDGLPLYRSSQTEFWPILFNLAEMPQVSPMVIGIFCGKAKTSDVDSFFTPFVDELNDIIRNGIWINSHKITVGIRCFVCDSPARAYVKGK